MSVPLRFEPYFRPTAWGGRRLGRFLGKKLPAEVPCGEAWEVSDHPSHASVVASGGWYGQTLRQLMLRHRADLLGPAAARYERFPWLIKLLDIHERLSVQVHPSAAHVRTLLPGENSKTEAWLVLAADPGSVVYAGLRPGVGPAELREALSHGTTAACLHQFTPQPGDFLFLRAGTVHAACGGVLLAEIQETSDATFRLYDWDRRDDAGRPRPLHIEQAMACIDWQQGPQEPTPVPRPEGTRREWQQLLVQSPEFRVEHLRRESAFALGGAGALQALIVTEGQGRLANGEFVMAGDAWVLPAALPSMTLQPDTLVAGLLCSLP